MQLTIRDVAKYFNVSERTVYRWLDQNIIPAYKVNDQYRFERSELLDWATSKKIPVSQDFFKEETDEEDPLPSLTEAVKAGGIYYRIEGSDKETVIRQMVEAIKLPDNVDREFLYQILMAREKMASTGIGDGIAIPHVRNPVILNIPQPVVNVCFLENHIEFGALDGKPVHCLFGLICPTARIHLHLISRLAFILRDEVLKKLLLEHGPRGEVLKEMERAEGLLLDKNKSSQPEQTSP